MAGLWVAPPVQGTSAADDVRTFFARTARERADAFALEEASRRPPRTPLVRARTVRTGDLPAHARPFVTHANAYGWTVRCTYAYGWECDKNGHEKAKVIMEPTGELTDTGRPQMRKTGVVPSDPVHSHLIRCTIPGDSRMLAAAYWKNGAWDFGVLHDASGLRREDGQRAWKEWVKEHGEGPAHLF